VEKAQIHPNPANKNVSVQYELEENEEGILRIYDLNGKQYQEIKILGIGRQSINIENYKNGIYLYTLEIEGEIIQREKLMIIK
ncbi:MAG: T9SS type A sorting domain-containing protein, partial [Chitinophagales bacterium]